MLKAEQVPYDAVEAYLEAVEHGCGVREVLARAINAWPGVATGAPWIIGVKNIPSIILPLPQKENSDD